MTIQDHIGPNRIIQDYAGQYRTIQAGVHILQIYGNLFPKFMRKSRQIYGDLFPKFMRKSRHFRISLHLVRAPILVRIFINGLNSPFPLPSLWIISVYQ